MSSLNDEFGKQLRSVVSDVDRSSWQGNPGSSSEGSGDESPKHRVVQAIVYNSQESSTRERNPPIRSRHDSTSNGSSNQPIRSRGGSTTHRPVERPIKQQNPERSPLLRPRQKDDTSSDDGLDVQRIPHLPKRYGTVLIPRRKLQQSPPPPPPKCQHWLLEHVTTTLLMRSTSVMVFLVLVVLGIVLTTAANLKLDQSTRLQIEPHHVLVYIMLLMVVFIIWVTYCIFPQTLKSSVPCHGSLIPSHLLTGIGVFGTVAAMSQMLYFVDFVKCSRHVHNLSAIYGIYPFVKTFFVYFQIYFFYKLSREGIRNCKLPGGNFFLMVTLATNMCIWWTRFLSDASNDPKLKSVNWLNHYYYGVNGYDACANVNVTGPKAKQLHHMVSELQPYITTCSMEYALLASALLLHVWQAMKDSDTSNSQILAQQHWTLWRVGFIVGLLSIPSVVVAYIHQTHVKNVGTAKVLLCCLQGIICTVLLFASLYCMRLIQRNFVKINKPMKLDVILLGIAFIGFPIFDLCSCFAVVNEFKNPNLPASEVVWFGLSCTADLFAAGLQFLFVKVAYEHKLPDVAGDKARKTAQRVRQFASFALVVNIAYWGAKTKQLRRSSSNPNDNNVAEVYFGHYTYFVVAHLAFPLCIFFHFHLAICFANAVSFYSQFGPLYHFVAPTSPEITKSDR